jgi:signal transduction histidine kinase
MLNVTRRVDAMRSGVELETDATAGVILGLMTAASIVVAVSTLWGAGSLRNSMWILVVVEGAIAGCGAWLVQRNSRRADAQHQSEAQRSQTLLRRLGVTTQAAGIYCWELDWNAHTVAFDASSLRQGEAAVAARRDLGAEIAKDISKWVDPQDQHVARTAIQQALARGERQCSFRYQVILPDRFICHIEAFVETECDAQGRLARSLGVSWDVTPEVEAAERAARDASVQRELLERLSVATKAAGLQSFEFDFKSGKMVCFDYGDAADNNPEAAQRLGDATLASILPEDLQQVKDATAAAIAGHESMMSIRYRRRDPEGSVRYIQSYHQFVYDQDGNATRALGANIDITELHQRQVELEALSVRFGIATRAAHAGVWEWRERTDVSWWNDTMFGIYGLPPASSPPNFSAVCNMIHPDDLPTAMAIWGSALNGSGEIRAQFRVMRPDGTVAHVEQAAVLLTDPGTSDRRVVGITLDVSERVAAEQRERLLQKQLREASHQSGMAEVATGVLHNVGNVLNSLGVSSSTVRARLRMSQLERLERVAALIDTNQHALGEFFVNDPRGRRLPEYLTALAGQLRQDVGDLDHELDAIDDHVHYLCKIVQAQQSFAKGSGAEEAVNVRELLETALTLKGQELRSAQITRDIPDLPEVWTNRYKLLQVVVNFVANASDAIAGNEPGKRQIAVRAHLTGDWLEIAVQDSGVGMAAELLDRVWEFGFTTKTHDHGFGLHSSALAAQQLGGSVAASSAGPGQGACFSVKIPARMKSETSSVAA